MEECMICFEEYTDFVIFPCNHKVCVICYPKLKRCPLCNLLLETPTRCKINMHIVCFLVVLLLVLFSAPWSRQ